MIGGIILLEHREKDKIMTKKVYRVIINMPGYMPDDEPQDYDTLQAAKAGVMDYINESREDGYGYRAYNGVTAIRKADLIRHEELLVGYLTMNGEEQYAISIAYVDESL